MAFPSDVLLPANAKYFGFVDDKQPFNSHWDIVWSFTFALTGTQHGFCTFLTNNSDLLSGIPGQYLGYLGSLSSTRYLLTESGEFLLDELGNKLIIEPLSGGEYDTSGILAIAFDSTGYFALSNSTNPGVPKSQVKPNSLIIRDTNNVVVFNETLSSLDTQFFLTSSTKNYQTLRFRFSNSGKKLSVDYKTDTTRYKTLTSISLTSFDPTIHSILYPGLTFCSPISSNSITPSTMFIKNFHVQGNLNTPSYETLNFIPLTASIPTTYTVLSGVSAIHL